MSHEHAEDHNPSNNPTFETVLTTRLSRRNMLGSTASAAALAVIGGGIGSEAAAHDDQGYGGSSGHGSPQRKLKLNFNPVAKSLEDAVTLPRGYSYDVLYALGDPISRKISDFANDGTDEASSFAYRGGDHHDGMYFFGLGRDGRYDRQVSARGLLCMNHEAITPAYLHPAGQTVVNGVRTVAEEVKREFYVHGVSVIEIAREKQRRHEHWSASFRKFLRPGRRSVEWDYEQASRYNRRIHTLTQMKLSGPAARSKHLITKYSPDGSATRGTVNNCANGYTPWGTYLTCEENLAGYFRRMVAIDNPKRTAKEVASFARYGVAGSGVSCGRR